MRAIDSILKVAGSNQQFRELLKPNPKKITAVALAALLYFTGMYFCRLTKIICCAVSRAPRWMDSTEPLSAKSQELNRLYSGMQNEVRIVERVVRYLFPVKQRE